MEKKVCGNWSKTAYALLLLFLHELYAQPTRREGLDKHVRKLFGLLQLHVFL